MVRGLRPDRKSFFGVYGLWQREPQVPPAFWRSVRKSLTVIKCLALLMVLLDLGLYLPAFRLQFRAMFGHWLSPGALLLLACCAALAWVPYYRITKRRFYERVYKADYRVCWECGYLLHGIPDRHACPECGRIYTEQLDTAAWKHWMETDDTNEYYHV